MLFKIIGLVVYGLACVATGILIGRKHKNVSDSVAAAASSAQSKIEEATKS